MPRIIDNVELHLHTVLHQLFQGARRADFCVGYFHLRGWGLVGPLVEQFRGRGVARVLVGMYRPPEEEMRELQRAVRREQLLDGPTIARMQQQIAQGFAEQIAFGVPTDEAEQALRLLARQLREGLVQVKVFLRHPLHAKLYIIERDDPVTPLVAIVGSSNLTLRGITEQGELNVDVVDQDAARKLQEWFERQWSDEYTIDFTERLAEIIEAGWAAERLIPPYHIYLKIAYRLCEDALAAERALRMPPPFDEVLLDFQKAAVALAVRIINPAWRRASWRCSWTGQDAYGDSSRASFPG